MRSRVSPLSNSGIVAAGVLSLGVAALLYKALNTHKRDSQPNKSPIDTSNVPQIHDGNVVERIVIRPDEPGQLEDDVSSTNMAEVFVRGINKKATAASILEHFSGAGEIESLRWTSGPKTERKGYCKLLFFFTPLTSRFYHDTFLCRLVTIQNR